MAISDLGNFAHLQNAENMVEKSAMSKNQKVGTPATISTSNQEASPISYKLSFFALLCRNNWRYVIVIIVQ